MFSDLIKEEIPNADKERKPKHQAHACFVSTLLQQNASDETAESEE
jgi:hypothetical protein